MVPPESNRVRLAHVSDIHVSARPLGMRWGDYLSKRAVTWLNVGLTRGRAFALSARVLECLTADVAARGASHLVFSGDATHLGLDAEMRRVAELLHVGRTPGLAVPGNHDYLTRSAQASGQFEHHFAPWQQGVRIGPETYPFAQQVGHVWLVAVNSARGNRWFWDASGEVGPAQRERLRRLLKELSPGPRILVTHYPMFLASGAREHRAHGLTDLDAVIDIARNGGIGLWLHGHRHRFYFAPRSAATPIPYICIGSSTQQGLWSYGDYRIENGELLGRQRVFDPAKESFRDGIEFALDIRPQ